eukprot:TRINITY_DN3256_c0_g2_i1.p1 TRINITY_DN3256_c0_g2~~TRINITY_DN3256_c0_g2_i1.p1  ORF type:complete len:106 (-),score=16.98 TRINITY_DN3256_c0_g2_i1:261-578(-)
MASRQATDSPESALADIDQQLLASRTGLREHRESTLSLLRNEEMRLTPLFVEFGIIQEDLRRQSQPPHLSHTPSQRKIDQDKEFGGAYTTLRWIIPLTLMFLFLS